MVIGILNFTAGKPFPLCDASALLLRLEMYNKPKGTSYDARWRELGAVAEEYCDSVNYFFYDYHVLLALLFGDKRAASAKLQGIIKEQYAEYANENCPDYNNMVVKEVGKDITKAMVAFAEEVNDVNLSH